MKYVLVIITVFSSSGGLDTETAFQEFHTREACERAAEGVREDVAGVAGTLGREIVARCFPLGRPARGDAAR